MVQRTRVRLHLGTREVMARVALLDRDVLARAPVNAHPLHNRATTAIAVADLIRFLAACGHAPIIVDIA